MNDLPDKVIQLDQVRVNRNFDKLCTCRDRKYTVDTTNKRVLCSGCGVVVEAYDAIKDMAYGYDKIQNQVEMLLEQRKQIMDYKPYLLTIRDLEKKYRGKKMLPCCPRCDEPFYLEEINAWTGKPYADARIAKWKNK